LYKAKSLAVLYGKVAIVLLVPVRQMQTKGLTGISGSSINKKADK
jgi:hypothetical protein